MALSIRDHRAYLASAGSKTLGTGIFLLLIFSIPRFILVLYANRSGNYQLVSVIFVIMMVLPWLLLNRNGRYKIGLCRISDIGGLFKGILLSAFGAALIFYLMLFMFGKGTEHPFQYIGSSYQNLPMLTETSLRLKFFFIYAGISMTFSPLGEEFFYRGLIHEYFAVNLGHTGASYLDSAAFALVHLAHFGIVYEIGAYHWLYWPSVIWMVLLFLNCRVFYLARVWSGAIWGSVASHAVFNLLMNYFIFFHLL